MYGWHDPKKQKVLKNYFTSKLTYLTPFPPLDFQYVQIIYGCCRGRAKKWNCWMELRAGNYEIFTPHPLNGFLRLLPRILLAWLLEHFTLIDDVFQFTPQSTHTHTIKYAGQNGIWKGKRREEKMRKKNVISWRGFSSHTNSSSQVSLSISQPFLITFFSLP